MAQRFIQGIRVATVNLFKRRLLLANTVSCGVLMGAGDVAVQAIERFSDQDASRPQNWARTGRMCVMGVVLGPFNHYWYTILDKVLPGRTTSIVLRKILADQIVASPFFAFTFFMGSGTLEGQPIHKSWEELRSKFWKVYKTDWMVWPAAQAINFYLLPPHLRVVYVAVVTFGWNTFLCYMKHKEEVYTETTFNKSMHLMENSKTGTLSSLKEKASPSTVQSSTERLALQVKVSPSETLPAQHHTSTSSLPT